MSRVLDVVGGKWRMNILWVINKHKKVRFNQLRREEKLKGLQLSV